MFEKLNNLRRNLKGRARYTLMRLKGLKIRVGRSFQCKQFFHLARPFYLKAGDHVFFGRHIHIGCNVEVGNYIMVGSYCGFVGGGHQIDGIGEAPIRYAPRIHDKPVVLKDNVWIGHGCTIMAGVTIETGAVVAAGSVVTKDVGPNDIVAGVPAKVLRKRRP